MKDFSRTLPKTSEKPSDVIKAFRKNFNISPAQLCDAIGISEESLVAIENNQREVGFEIALKISIFFDIDVISILYPNGLDNIEEFLKIKEKAKLIKSQPTKGTK